MKALIKYARFEGAKAILIPTAEGINFIETTKPRAESGGGRVGISLEKGEETIGKAALIAYIVTVDSPIMHLSIEQNIPLNQNKYRIFSQNGINYFLTLPYTVYDSKF